MKTFMLEKTVPVKLISVVNDTLTVNEYHISFTMLTEAEQEDAASLKQAQQNQDIGFAKVVTFLSDVVDGSIVFDVNTMDKHVNTFYDFNNNFIVLPDSSDQMLVVALHCKLNAIVHENTYVDRIKFRDTHENICYEYVCVDEEYTELPSDKQWSTELSYWPGCWWNRPDINTMDRNARDQEEYDDWLKLKSETNIDDLNMQIFKEIEQAFSNVSTCAGEVIEVNFEKPDPATGRPIWKPVLVD
jgi:hypothetical protein